MDNIDIKKDKELDFLEYNSIIEKQNVSENTFLDYEKLDQVELVCRYIMEVKNKGHFLPYEDYDIVKKWIKCSKNIDHLLVVLDEVFGELNINVDPIKGKNIKLKNIDKKVLKKLKLSEDIY